MSGCRVARWLPFLLGLVTVPARADPENPFLTPEHPTAEDMIIVNAHSGPCDILQDGFLEPEITREGQEILVQFTGQHYSDPIYCLFDPRIESAPIGRFSPGSYTVTVQWRYYNLVEWVQVTLGTLPLTVGDGAPAGEPVPLPMAGRFGLALLGLMLVTIVAVRFCGARRGGT